jgi:chemotaxis protein methyltransferase CheR
MSGPSNPPSMTPEEHLLLSELIESHFGLSFPAEKRELLELRLQVRMRALHLQRFMDYYLHLRYDLDRELAQLAEIVTNNESYFLRERHQLEGLLGTGLERLAEGRHLSRLKILCAGCAAGEEPYSLVILGKQRVPWLELDITAFDLDGHRLEAARQAVYGPAALRAVGEEDRARYFRELEPDRWELRAPLRRGVRLFRGNILDPACFQPARSYDALFCRNVLIYFSERAFREAIESFAVALRPGGLLFLGHSESIIGKSSRFETLRLPNCIAYRRRES